MKSLFLCITVFIFITPAFSCNRSECPNSDVFFQAFNHKNIKRLHEISNQLAGCSETQHERYSYFIARALYDKLQSVKQGDEITKLDYEEILAIYPEFWAALADLGDLSAKNKDYKKALNYYERAILDLDIKKGEPTEIKQDKDNLPSSYILTLKENADNARLLASSENQFIEPIRTRDGNLKGMYSFRIRGVEIKSHKYPIYFKYKSSELAHNQDLDLLFEALQNTNQPDISITGHTDYIGSDDYNLRLSQERAESLKQFLIKIKKYNGKIKAIGKGKKNNVKMHSLQRNDLSDDEWRRLNRRVEIHLNEKH